MRLSVRGSKANKATMDTSPSSSVVVPQLEKTMTERNNALQSNFEGDETSSMDADERYLVG